MHLKYVRSGDVSIAFRTMGEGPLNLVLVPGWVSHLDYMASQPRIENFMKRLSSFSRLVLFDKRGTGLSDRVSELPDLQTRMDDVRAVMDDLGLKKAALFGISEGVPMSLLFAATCPQRTTHLVLYGGMARSTATDDYPWAPHPDAIEMNLSALHDYWGAGYSLDVFSPTLADDENFRNWWIGFERTAASPGAMEQMIRMFAEIDVRHVLPAVRVPTLVVHRKGDRVANYRGARWMAEQMPNAKYVELRGQDHLPFAADSDSILDEVQEFLTGVRPTPVLDRVLATCLFTDLVDSTKRAAELGDAKWRDLLEAHRTGVRKHLERYRGREIKTIGDGFLALFDGPARGVLCAKAAAEETRSMGLEMRAGLHAGEVEMDDADVGGIAVHIAARVAAMAGPGEVLVSSTVKDLVAGSGLTFDDKGAHGLKGVPGDWRIYLAN